MVPKISKAIVTAIKVQGQLFPKSRFELKLVRAKQKGIDVLRKIV